MTIFEEVTCKSAEDLLHKLGPYGEKLDYRCQGTWIFRGQANDTWSLMPSIWRDEGEGRKLFQRMEQQESKNISAMKEQLAFDMNYIGQEKQRQFRLYEDNKRTQFIDMVKNAFVEYKMILEFAIVSNSIGLKMPHFSEFCRFTDKFSDYYLNCIVEGKPRNVWEFDIVALAQHHGLPTRLLDWTISYKTAAYFACKDEKEASKPLAIFALQMDGLRSPSIDYPPVTWSRPINKVYVETHNNDFLRVQDGLFTHSRYADEYFINHKKGEYPTLENTLETYYRKHPSIKHSPAYKFVLCACEKARVLKILNAENINKTTLHPTYGNVVAQLKQQI